MSNDAIDREKFAEEKANQPNPGDFDKSSAIMENDVTGDDDTNGISAGMLRFGDEDNIKYDEKLDRVGNEIAQEDK